MPQSGVQLKLDRSGGVAVFCGEAEIGQGSDSILAAMVAEVLGVDAGGHPALRRRTPISRPVDLGSYSSRVTLMMGNAAIQAAERARDMIAKAVAEQLEVPADRLVFADRRVFDAQDPEKGITFQEAVIAAEARFGTLGTIGSYIPPRSPGKYRGAGVGPVASLLVLGGGGRGRGRSRDRRVEPGPRLDGARHRAERSTRRW